MNFHFNDEISIEKINKKHLKDVQEAIKLK